MPAKAGINARAGRILAGSALVLIAAGLALWAAWNDQPPELLGEPSLIALQSATSESNPPSTNSAPVIGAPLNPTSEANDSRAGQPAPEEIQKVQLHLIAARQLLHEIEARLVKPVTIANTDTAIVDHVHLPALTREQLDPVYTQLSEASRNFPAGGAGAKLFREEADKFLSSLRKLPAKHAMRKIDRKTGDVSYGVTLLAEDATVTRGENGALDIQSSRIHVNGGASTKPEDVAHLFRGDPGVKSQ
jgi:hypothetical protein